MHKGFVKRVFETYPEVFPEFPPPGEDEDGDGDGGGGGDENENAPLSVRAFEATRWAWSVAHGRASRVPGKPGLAFVPVADLINDRGFPGDGAGSLVDDKKEGGESARRRFLVVYDPHLDRAAVYAKRRLAAGEEVAECVRRLELRPTRCSPQGTSASARARVTVPGEVWERRG